MKLRESWRAAATETRWTIVVVALVLVVNAAGIAVNVVAASESSTTNDVAAIGSCRAVERQRTIEASDHQVRLLMIRAARAMLERDEEQIASIIGETRIQERAEVSAVDEYARTLSESIGDPDRFLEQCRKDAR